jgi:hypothetical protein
MGGGWYVLIKCSGTGMKVGESSKRVTEQGKNGGIVLHRLYLHREWIIIINDGVLVSGCHGHDYDHPVGL